MFGVKDIIAADGMELSVVFVQEDTDDAFSAIEGKFVERPDGRLMIESPDLDDEDDEGPKREPTPRPWF